MFIAMAFFCKSPPTCDGALLSWAWLNTCLPLWKWCMNSSFCFACTHSFCFTYCAVFILTHEFCHICLYDSLPHFIVGGESRCVGLSYQLGLKHSTEEKIFLYHLFTQGLDILKTEMLNSKFLEVYLINLSNNMHVSGPKFVDIDTWLKSVSGLCHDFLVSERSRAFRIMALPLCWDLCLFGDRVRVATSVGVLDGPAIWQFKVRGHCQCLYV